MIENIINILKQKKIQRGKLKEQDVRQQNQQIKQYLKQFGLLQNYMKDVQKGDQFLDEIVDQFEYQEFKQGDIIYKQQDFINDNNFIYFIMQGRVSMFEMKQQQTIKLQQKQYQDLQKLRKQLAFLGKNQDYQSSKRYLDQIMNLENDLQVKQIEELQEICSRYQHLQDYFYVDWKQKYCKYIRKEDICTDDTIGESDIFINRRPFTCLVVSQILRTVKIDIKLFHEKFFSKIFQIQFLSGVLKEQLHLYDQNSIQIQRISELFELQYFSNHIFLFNEDSKGIYVLLYGDVAQMIGDKEIQILSEGDIFGMEDIFVDKRKSSFIVRNEEKAKVYFLKKETILENKLLVESLLKINTLRLQNNQQFVNNNDPSLRKKQLYFERRFKITEEKLQNNLSGSNLGLNKIQQRQKHLIHQMEQADEIINNSKNILEKQQQTFIKTFQEQKYLQQILNQQRKINARIPSLFSSDEVKQQKILKPVSKQSGSFNSLDQQPKMNNRNIILSKNINDNNAQPSFTNTNNLIETLKIYFNNKRNTIATIDTESSNFNQVQTQKNFQIINNQVPLSDERRHLKLNSRMNQKKQDQQMSPQHALKIQANPYNFAEEVKGKRNIFNKNSKSNQLLSSPQRELINHNGNKKQLPQLEQYLKIMNEQNGNSIQSNYLLSDENTIKLPQAIVKMDKSTDCMLSADNLEKSYPYKQEENSNYLMKNQSAINNTIKNDSLVFQSSSNKSSSLDLNKFRSKSGGQNKNKITITSFLNSNSKSLKKLDIMEQDKQGQVINESQDNQNNIEEQPPTRRYQLEILKQEKIQELDALQFQSSAQQSLNLDIKQGLSINKFNRSSYLQNIFPDRRDSVQSQSISSTFDLTTKNSDETSSPIHGSAPIKKNNQLIFKSKFQATQNEPKLFNSTVMNINKETNNNNLMQKSDVFSDKLNQETSQTTSRAKLNNFSYQSMSQAQHNINYFTKKNSLSDLQEKLVSHLQHKITEYSDKGFLQSNNQLKEQKKQINEAITSEILLEKKVTTKSNQKNTLNLLGQINNQQSHVQEPQNNQKLNENIILFENKMLNDLIKKNNNL